MQPGLHNHNIDSTPEILQFGLRCPPSFTAKSACKLPAACHFFSTHNTPRCSYKLVPHQVALGFTGGACGCGYLSGGGTACSQGCCMLMQWSGQ